MKTALRREIILFDCGSPTKRLNTLCGQSVGFLIVKLCGDLLSPSYS